MELHDRGAELPPFWAAVRRRHPDVDIVVLPDEREPAGEPAGAVELATALELTGAVAARAWAAVATEAPGPPGAGFAFGPDEAHVVARARVSAQADPSPLPALTAALQAEGWEVRELPGAARRLVARHDDAELVASYADSGVLVLTVSSAPLLVGVDRARELVRG
jgi:hypothetical protein